MLQISELWLVCIFDLFLVTVVLTNSEDKTEQDEEMPSNPLIFTDARLSCIL